MGLLMTLFTTAMNTSLEVVEKAKEYIVSDKMSLKKQLQDLGVNLREVIDINTDKPVKNWDDVLGVFKKEGKIYAYSRSLNSEIKANLKMFA